MPSKDATRKLVGRKRRQVEAALPAPQNLAELIIPQAYQVYEMSPGNVEKYLLADSFDAECILMFGREHNGTWQSEMKEVFMDGAFLLAPPLFNQIFVVLSRRGGFVFPVLMCLLPNKTGAIYEKLFCMIHDIWPQFNPESICVDFELAIHNAVRTEWPEAELKGCFFHLVQNMKKHLATANLLGRYNTNSEFALHARMLSSVAFLPEEDVIKSLSELEETLPLELDLLIGWFTNTYVGRLRENGVRAQPVFPYSVWGVRDRTLAGRDRTNNFAEAFHRSMQLSFGVAHPVIWKFIDGLKKLQKLYDAEYERFVGGHSPPRKRKRYEEADERIMKKVQNYDGTNIMEYLRGLAHNYRMD